MAKVIDRQWVDFWALDIAKDVLKDGELWDVDVIDQSIELILGTTLGERVFNPSFGSNFSRRVFDSMDENIGARILEDTVNAIKRWEDRIIILENQVQLTIIEDQNTILLVIPYIIKGSNIKSKFQKKIIV